MSDSTEQKYSITNVDLNDDKYEVKQKLVRNKYKIRNSDDEVVLRGKQKMLKLKEEFPFVTDDDTDAFTVKAQSISDTAGNYTLIDSETDEEIVVLDESYSLFTENWTIRDSDTGKRLAEIKSKNKVVCVLRNFSGIASFIPNKFEILDSDGNKVGDIDGQFSVSDTYEVEITDDETIPKEVVVASACILDALENTN